ncbi:hypothetical protein DFAR_550009 [Desulfarculales bacterium]
MEAACLRALAYGAFSSKSVERIIDKKRDKAPLLTPAPESSLIFHPNIRGAGYFLTAHGVSHADLIPSWISSALWGCGGHAQCLRGTAKHPQGPGIGLRGKNGSDGGQGGHPQKNRRLKNRLAKAKLRHYACLKDIDYRQRRGMDKSLIIALTSCRWAAGHHNLLTSGPTGVSKSFLACVLGYKACLEGYSVSYKRGLAPLREMVAARGDGSYQTMIVASSKTNQLILDDWGLEQCCPNIGSQKPVK